MIRFHNSKRPLNKKLLIFISDFIRRLFGGDRIGRLSKMMITQSKKIYLQNKKKITILDFGCGSMEISKKLENIILAMTSTLKSYWFTSLFRKFSDDSNSQFFKSILG